MGCDGDVVTNMHGMFSLTRWDIIGKYKGKWCKARNKMDVKIKAQCSIEERGSEETGLHVGRDLVSRQN